MSQACLVRGVVSQSVYRLPNEWKEAKRHRKSPSRHSRINLFHNRWEPARSRFVSAIRVRDGRTRISLIHLVPIRELAWPAPKRHERRSPRTGASFLAMSPPRPRSSIASSARHHRPDDREELSTAAPHKCHRRLRPCTVPHPWTPRTRPPLLGKREDAFPTPPTAGTRTRKNEERGPHLGSGSV